MLAENLIGGNAEFEKNFGGLYLGVILNVVDGELEIEKNDPAPPIVGWNTIDAEIVEGDGWEEDEEGPATHWRIRSVTAISDHWNMSEMTFYSDTACTVEFIPVGVVVVDTEGCAEPPDVLRDGNCSFSGNCDPGLWANNFETPGAQESGAVRAGFIFDAPVAVQCVTICQAGGDEGVPGEGQRSEAVFLERSMDSGLNWQIVAEITGPGMPGEPESFSVAP